MRASATSCVPCPPADRRWAVCLPLLAILASPAVKAQAPARELVCQMRYASQEQVLRQGAGPDPYAAATVEVPGRFRLRAVVLGTPSRIQHVTLTSYQLSEEQPPLILHQVRLKGPFAEQSAIPDLTGWQHVYAGGLGREMRFGCALLPPADAKASEVGR